MIASIEQLIHEIQQTQIPASSTAPKRSRWTRKDEALFEQLVVRFGTDYALLGSFLPHKTERQLRKRYRFLLRWGRLEKMEREMRMAQRKAYFDQSYLQETDSSAERLCSDLCPQSLE